MKVSILGHCGSGKSTLARRLATALHIPHLELDRLWFSHGGTNSLTDSEKQKVHESICVSVTEFLAQNESWVTDGVYSKVQPEIIQAADIVIYIDIPLHRRMYNHVLRVIKRQNRHSEISVWEDLLFTYDMIRRTKKTNIVLPPLFVLAGNKLHIAKNYSEVAKLETAIQSGSIL